jgi:hypothetical protein
MFHVKLVKVKMLKNTRMCVFSETINKEFHYLCLLLFNRYGFPQRLTNISSHLQTKKDIAAIHAASSCTELTSLYKEISIGENKL